MLNCHGWEVSRGSLSFSLEDRAVCGKPHVVNAEKLAPFQPVEMQEIKAPPVMAEAKPPEEMREVEPDRPDTVTDQKPFEVAATAPVVIPKEITAPSRILPWFRISSICDRIPAVSADPTDSADNSQP